MSESYDLDEILALTGDGESCRADLSGFGAETLGCAARAAARSCPGRSLAALHAFFLRPVAGTGIVFAVETVREGRRLAHRRVRVEAAGKLCFEALASFTAPASGHAFQDARIDAALPGPEVLPSPQELALAEGRAPEEEDGPFDFRWCETPWAEARPGAPARYDCWVRPSAALADDPALRAGALAYLSDYHSHFPVAIQLGGAFDTTNYTSLDTSLWLHRDVPWRGWWLLRSECDAAHAGRALSRRRLFAATGELIATMAQEALVPGPDGG